MFIFGDKTSTEMGLQCVLYTLRNKAKFPYNTYNIPGRAEPIIEMSDYAEPVKVEVECDLMDIAKIDEIYAWLHGRGILIDELHPDKYRIAYSVESINPIMLNDQICTLNITFICSAFMYAVDNELSYGKLSSFTYTNNGTFYSEPIYEIAVDPASENSVYVYGYIFELTVGNSDFDITAEREDWHHTIVLDAGRQLAYYKDTGASILSRTTGTIPFFDVGKNSILYRYGEKSQIKQSDPCNFLDNLSFIKNERWL